MKNILNRLNKLDYSKLKKLLADLHEQAKPLITKWGKLTPREKGLLVTLVGVCALFILVSIIGSFIGIAGSISKQHTTLQSYQMEAKGLNYEYQQLSKMVPNQFTDVTKTKIAQDMTQILGVKDPNITITNGELTVKADSASFESVALFLEQLRKSYGLFPEKLIVTRLATSSGYVSLNATFVVEDNAN